MSFKKQIICFFIIHCCASNIIFSQQQPRYHFTIDSNRIIHVNGEPFFPIGECYEMESPDKYKELSDAGFNYLNLFTQNHSLNSCYHSYDAICGDRTSGTQFNQLLGYWNFNYLQNANRIFNLAENHNLYILSDDYFDWPDDLTEVQLNSYPCDDNISLNPPFNQTIRDQSIIRLNGLASADNSRLMGGYAIDDVCLFQIGPNPPMYYYNNFLQNRINNCINTYNYFKINNPDQLVFMKIPPFFFPRIHDIDNWQDLNLVRQKWLQDARQFVQGTDVLYATDAIDKRWSENNIYSLYDDAKPSTWQQHYDVLMRDVGNYRKAIWGGLDYDEAGQSGSPDLTDIQLHNIVKWHTYIGIIKGATGLVFFGQHHAATQSQPRRVWNAVKSTVSEMTNTLHLDKTVFVLPNSFSEGHTLTGSYSNNLSYAVFKKNNDFNDYWLLITNNPNGYCDDKEPDNTITISSSNFHGKAIKELFSGTNVTVNKGDSISITLPWYGTAIFHVSDEISSAVPDIYSVKQYPNPFNPKTRISFNVSYDNSFVELKIYNIIGKEIKNIVSEYKLKGSYETEFDGSDLASGIYIYRIQIGNGIKSGKMILLK